MSGLADSTTSLKPAGLGLPLVSVRRVLKCQTLEQIFPGSSRHVCRLFRICLNWLWVILRKGGRWKNLFQPEEVCGIFGRDFFIDETHTFHGVKKEIPTLKRQPFKPMFRLPIPAFEI
jgi:hypothetical protein